MNGAYWMILGLAAPPAGSGQGGGGAGLGMFVPMLLIFAIFYFMLIRPQQRKDKERKQAIAQIKSGDRVVFSGGILGTVTNVKERTFVLKIADGVKVEVLRGAVNRTVEKDDKLPSDGEEVRS